MILIYLFFFFFQLLNVYANFLTPLNPYVFSAFFILLGFTKKVNIINIKLLCLLFITVICFICIYAAKFTFFSSFSITAKAIQFNFGYLILIPGFTVLFSLFPKIKLKDVLAVTFWAISGELLIEFVLIRILGVSPGLFVHYPKTQHITLNQITGEYTASRLLGLAGNSSVTGVLYSASFVLYLGCLYLEQNLKLTKSNLLIIGIFIICFFMISSGSAFFAMLFSLFAVWSQKKGSFLKNSLIALLIVPTALIMFNYISTLTEAFGNKFTTDYLILLLLKDEADGSLPILIQQMSVDYHWYNLIFGCYFFEWGNADAVLKTVDYFFVNLIYEFGLIGLVWFFLIIRLVYKVLKRQALINENFLKFGLLVIISGSLHYPAIAYMASQVFLSAISAVAIRDIKVSRVKSKHFVNEFPNA